MRKVYRMKTRSPCEQGKSVESLYVVSFFLHALRSIAFTAEFVAGIQGYSLTLVVCKSTEHQGPFWVTPKVALESCNKLSFVRARAASLSRKRLSIKDRTKPRHSTIAGTPTFQWCAMPPQERGRYTCHLMSTNSAVDSQCRAFRAKLGLDLLLEPPLPA